MTEGTLGQPSDLSPRPAGRRRGGTGRVPRGRLKIGDEWMAIQIIARSQANPQKAVAELVENSIDAGATRVVITRGRKRGRVFLRISDDGRGVPLNPEGAPDFDYVATHVCDSLKRRLGERERGGVQGEFGIGLLGFWSIGRDLDMISQSGDAPPHMMTMRAGSRTYDRRRYLGSRVGSGVDVTIHDIHREVQSRLTAEKLQRYLGEELRERIRRAGVILVIEDRLPPSRTVEVRPAVFQGERIAELDALPVADHPPIRAEIYLPPEPAPGAPRPAVALYRLGTRVCSDIAALPEFVHEPWSLGRLEGALDYADFHLSPASREGFTPDAAYHAFVEALRRIEPLLLDRLRREDEARADRAGRTLLRELQSVFVRVLRQLPAGDYEWFGADGQRPFAGGSDGRPGGADAIPGIDGSGGVDGKTETQDTGGPPTSLEESEAQEESASPSPAQPALLTGALTQVAIRPSSVRIAVGRRRRVEAIGRDASGLIIEHGIEYAWSLSADVGALVVEPGRHAAIQAGERPARGKLTVRARCAAENDADPAEAMAEAEVLVEAEAPRRSFPPPVFVHAPGESWRSRWDPSTSALEVNSGHPDYLAARVNPARRRRYLARLYAKELVLHNFGHEPAAPALDRFLEVLTRLDDQV